MDSLPSDLLPILHATDKIPIETTEQNHSKLNDASTKMKTSQAELSALLKEKLKAYNFSCLTDGCEETFFTISKFFKHLKKCLDEEVYKTISLQVPCPECTAGPLFLPKLITHFRKRHLLIYWYCKQLDEGNWAICQNHKCAKYIDKLAEVAEHARSCRYLWKCKHCAIELKTEDKVEKHHCCTSSENEEDTIHFERNSSEECDNKRILENNKNNYSLRTRRENGVSSNNIAQKTTLNDNSKTLSEKSINESSRTLNHDSMPALDSSRTFNDNISDNLNNNISDNSNTTAVKSSTINNATDVKIETSQQNTESKLKNENLVDLVKWADSVSKYDYKCPMEGCQKDAKYIANIVPHIYSCISHSRAQEVRAEIKELQIPCLVNVNSRCFKRQFPFKDILNHYRTKHLTFVTLLHDASQGETFCLNYKCATKISSAYEALFHANSCGYLWKCVNCPAELKSLVGRRTHTCPEKDDAKRPLMVVDSSGEPVTKKKKSHNSIADLLTDLEKWAEDLSNHNYRCPVLDCTMTFNYIPSMKDHIRCCAKDNATRVMDLLMKVQIPCLIDQCTECYEEKFTFKYLFRHYRSKHLTFATLLHDIFIGECVCYNHKCCEPITTPAQAQQHAKKCGFWWKCPQCDVTYKSIVGKKTHMCSNTDDMQMADTSMDTGVPEGSVSEPPHLIETNRRQEKDKDYKPRAKRLNEDSNLKPKDIMVDLHDWAEELSNFVYKCPITACREEFLSHGKIGQHIRVYCEHIPTSGLVTKVADLVKKQQFQCLVDPDMQCYEEKISYKDYTYHMRAKHLTFVLLLIDLGNGEAVCYNHRCTATITTAVEAQQHAKNCKFLWKCEHCYAEYRSIVGRKSHSCHGTMPVKRSKRHEDTVDENGKRKKRKSANKARSTINEISSHVFKDENEEEEASSDEEFKKQDQSSSEPFTSDDENAWSDDMAVEQQNPNHIFRTHSKNIPSPFIDSDFYEKWMKENSSEELLFAHLIPPPLSIFNESEYKKYLPSYEGERKIEVNYINSNRKKMKSTLSAPPLTPFPKLTGSCTMDLNAGGPVWSLCWCPKPGNETQYLAVSTHKSFSERYVVNNAIKEERCIQIWRVEKDCELVMCICVDYGPIYDMQWCPSACYEENKRLGLLAVACGDGLLRIFSIPHLSSISSAKPVFAHLEPSLVLLNGRVDSMEAERNSVCTCVDWQRLIGHSHIAAGFADGCIRIWNLNTKSIFLKLNHENNTALLPVRSLDIHSHCVRTLAWCPYNPNIIASGSTDKMLKIFNIHDAENPIYNIKREILFRIKWPANRVGLFVTSDVCFNATPTAKYFVLDYLFFKDVSELNESEMNHPTTRHNAAIFDVSYNERMDMLATCCAAGEVCISKHQDKFAPKLAQLKRIVQPVYRIEAEYNVVNEPSHQTTTQTDNLNLKEEYEKEREQMEEEFNHTKYKFIDSNKFEFTREIIVKDPAIERVTRSDNMTQSKISGYETKSVHRVSWNPNEGSHTLLATGTRMGVVRIHNFKAWKT